MEKSYVNDVAKKLGIEVNNDEIKDINDYLFNEENGVVYHLVASKLKDLEYEKEYKNQYENESELER
jgi:uncharacterized protein YpuA (DUF1002 family)